MKERVYPKGVTGLTVYMEKVLHTRLKSRVAKDGMTMRGAIHVAVTDYLKKKEVSKSA